MLKVWYIGFVFFFFFISHSAIIKEMSVCLGSLFAAVAIFQ